MGIVKRVLYIANTCIYKCSFTNHIISIPFHSVNHALQKCAYMCVSIHFIFATMKSYTTCNFRNKYTSCHQLGLPKLLSMWQLFLRISKWASLHCDLLCIITLRLLCVIPCDLLCVIHCGLSYHPFTLWYQTWLGDRTSLLLNEVKSFRSLFQALLLHGY
jgi:hypothetical protein